MVGGLVGDPALSGNPWEGSSCWDLERVGFGEWTILLVGVGSLGDDFELLGCCDVSWLFGGALG